MRRVHDSPYAGDWYPDDSGALRDLLDQAFRESGRRVALCGDPALAFVVPHAAPVYSGVVAAAAYRIIADQKPQRVIVLGFSHRGRRTGIALPDVDAIRTPMGEVPVDRDLPFPLVSESRLCDHSVEIQLPFLQLAAPEARVALVYVGELTPGERAGAAVVLRGLLAPGTVLVASSDFTHYGRGFGYLPFPVDSNTRERLYQLDRGIWYASATLDAGKYLGELQRTGSTMCGYDPVALLLETLKPLRAVQPALDYQTSAELTGNWSHSVSYAALAYFCRKEWLEED